MSAEDRNQIIADYMKRKPTLETMSLEEARAGVKMAKLKQCETEVQNALIDWNASVKECLTLHKPSTARAILNGLNSFGKWCKTNNADPARITRPQVIAYRDFLVEAGKSNLTVNSYLANVAVVWSYIIDKHELTRNNPFRVRGLKVAQKCKREKFTPTRDEDQKILEYLKHQDKTVYHTLRLQMKYGSRIGSFLNMRREGNKLLFISKGRECRTPLVVESKDIPQVDALLQHWKGYNSNSFDKLINRWLKRCFAAGVVEHYYTSHAFRRAFAEALELSSTPRAIISKSMNHSSLASITPYLDTIDKRMSTFTGLDFIK